MNKFVKVLLVIAAVFASMGIGLTVGGAVMGASSENGDVVQEVKESFRNAFEFFYSDDWEEEWEEEVDNPENAQGEKNGDSQVYELAQAENLEIELRYDELILEEYTGTGILVEVKDDSKGDVLVREDGTTLKIISNRKLKKKRQVKLSLPKDRKFKNVDIEVASGNVDVRGNLSADNLEVTLGAGEFVNSGSITVEEADLEVGAGSLAMKSLSAEKIDGQCGVGEMNLEVNGCEEDYSYNLECGIGNIDLASKNYSGLGKEKKIHNPGTAGEIELECGIGNVSVTFTKNNSL